ncbi:MAG: hypothetical protein V3U07_05265 [Nitrospirales bacterium]
MSYMSKMMSIIGAGLLVFILAMPTVWAEDSAQMLSDKSMAECQKGRRAKDSDIRLVHFERGRALAEKAVKLDDRLADAHFALFCSIGERMRANGEVLFSVFEYGEMMNALDKTLSINPNHLDALSSKGTILIEIPRLIGGDPEKGEVMLRQVIKEDPTAINARVVVARACAERGEKDEALMLAKTALDLAKEQKREDLIPEAQETFVKIQTQFTAP